VAAAQAAGVTAYGLLGLDGMQLALPLTVLREVIPAPAVLGALPAVAPGLLGAVELRDRVIPVLDLGRALGWPEVEGERGQVIAVAVHAGRVLGLLADGVRGITMVGAGDLQPIRADGADLVFSHAFERPEDGSLASLLDVAALFRVPGMPALHEEQLDGLFAPGAGPDGVPGAAGGGSLVVAGTRPMMILRCGPVHLALDAVAVHTVLPTVQVQPSPVRGGSCRGVTRYRSVDVPAVDLLDVLGLGSLADDDARRGIVLSLEHGLVALLLSEVIDIVPVPVDLMLPLPPLTVRSPDLFEGVLPLPAGQHLVLAAGALGALPELVGLSACNTGPGTTPSGRDAPAAVAAGGEALAQDGFARAGRTYLTYSVGADVATPLEQVAEIIPFDPALATIGTGQDPVLGVFVHRSQALPVVDLPALLGHGSTDPASCALLLVRVGTAQVGYLVRGLRAIERSVWEEAQDGSEPGRGSGLGARPSLQVGEGTDRRMVPMVDLYAMARELVGLGSDDAGPGAGDGVPDADADAEPGADPDPADVADPDPDPDPVAAAADPESTAPAPPSLPVQARPGAWPSVPVRRH